MWCRLRFAFFLHLCFEKSDAWACALFFFPVEMMINQKEIYMRTPWQTWLCFFVPSFIGERKFHAKFTSDCVLDLKRFDKFVTANRVWSFGANEFPFKRRLKAKINWRRKQRCVGSFIVTLTRIKYWQIFQVSKWVWDEFICKFLGTSMTRVIIISQDYFKDNLKFILHAFRKSEGSRKFLGLNSKTNELS